MNILTLLNDSLLTNGQIVWVVVICVLFAALVATNVLLLLYFRKSRERKLCTYQLQNKREELLNQLQALINGDKVSETDEEEDEEEQLVVNDVDDDVKEDKEQADKHYLGVVAREDVDETLDAEILAVADLSDRSRHKLNVVDSKYDDKRYYVRYTYSFEAKLRNSSDEVKDRYVEIMNDFYQYKVKLQLSYNQIRVYKGRETFAIITFSGKTLCVAFALNPADYAGTKYRGIDKSHIKRFAKTPLMLKLTSLRKVQYAKYLMLQLADANTIVMEEHVQTLKFDLSAKTVSELYDEDKLRILILGEVPESVTQSEEEVEEVEEEELKEELDNEEFVRYNRSFIARIIQADDELKARYSELKNHILSYHNIFNKITWKREAFYCDKRTCLATFAIHGKTLCLFLAVDPSKFDGTKYKVEDRAAKRPHAKMPTMYRIRSDRSTKFAKEMLNVVFAEKGIAENPDYKPVNFRPAYKSTENLIKKGYIHASNSAANDEQ